MPRPKRTLAAAAALAFLLAGCSSDGDTEAGDTPLPTGTGRAPTSTASTTASPSGATTSTPSSTHDTSAPSTSTPSGSSSEADTSTSVDTDATTSSGVNSNGLPPGLTTPEAKRAEKFVRDYLAAYNRAIQAPNLVSELDKFSSAQCEGCTRLRDSIEKMRQAKTRVVGDQAIVERAVVDRSSSSRGYDVFATVRQPKTRYVDASGKTLDEIVPKNAVTDRRFTVGTTDGQMRVISIHRVAGGIE